MRSVQGPKAVLRNATNGTAVHCIAIDMTIDGFEVESQDRIEVGSKLELTLQDKRVVMRVKSHVAQPAPIENRYTVVAEGDRGGYQEVVARLLGIQVGADGHETMSGSRGLINGVMARAKRLNSAGYVNVLVKTWGTRLEYRLTTEDLSRTGALLVSEGGDPLPFQQGTLLEVMFWSSLLPEGKVILCSAKVIRKTEQDEGARGRRCTLGVQLLEMDREVQSRWERLIYKVQAMALSTSLAEQAAGAA